MVMFPFSSARILEVATLRGPLEEEEELRRLERSLPLALGTAGSGLTVMSGKLLSLLALVTERNRRGGSSLVIVALPSRYQRR